MGELVKSRSRVLSFLVGNQPSIEHKMSTDTFLFRLTVYLFKKVKSAHFRNEVKIYCGQVGCHIIMHQ